MPSAAPAATRPAAGAPHSVLPAHSDEAERPAAPREASDGGKGLRTLSRGFAKLFAGGMLGKALGVLREISLAASFGTGVGVGAFRAGQTATVVATHSFIGDTLNGSFIPLCGRYARTDPERAQALFWSLVVALCGLGFGIGGTLYLGGPLIARLLVPGFGPGAQSLTVDMIRAMAFGVPPYLLGTLFSYKEMAHGRYLIASVRASLQNLGLLAGIGLAVWTARPVFLAWGYTAYTTLLALFGAWALARNRLVERPRLWAWREARTVLGEFARAVRPLLALPLAFQAVLVVERVVASLISPGAVAALDYAKFFSESGLALLAVPLGLAGLSELGRMKSHEARDALQRGVALLLVLLVPCSLFLAFHGVAMVQVVFGRGRFDSAAVVTTGQILVGLSVGLWAHVIGYVLLKSLSARERNPEVFRITALASVTHVLVNVLLYRLVGPSSLGLAIASYGLVILALTARATDVTSTILAHLKPLSVGCVLYVPIALWTRGGTAGMLLLAVLTTAAYWAGYVYCLPRLRAALLPSLSTAGGAG